MSGVWPSSTDVTLIASARFLRGAGPTSLTAWVPIGDISPRSGGLLYLEDSVSLGLEIEDAFTEMNKTLTAEERLSAFNVNVGTLE